MSKHHKLFQIFRAGRHVCSDGRTLNFSEQEVSYMAIGYNPKRLCAPLVLGHPRDNLPEYGAVDSLFMQGGKLYAQARVNESLIGMVKARSYTTVSASFMEPDAPNNPTPGVYYLRHVGFLGACPPAVKGMEALSFSEHEIDFSEGGSDEGSTNESPFFEGMTTDPARLKVFNLAMDYQRVCPGMSFVEAVQLAEIIL
ncbi:hypothetical protein COW64_15880 [bacterium (Candidatus Blackallbacteria) CG18_big_fil_WC_8_21_14_2_50_49_26]|nr:MAG: hypothetical protein COW64_15880 [bacterium (Candidatus Blackallbacteria) CG18_big_fil_WC_8_21_14_2_50_49_26]